MDREKYLDLFLSEAREHIAASRELIEELRAGSGDAKSVHALFRHAHSLKGMAATMGFAEMTALAHALEDGLEALRERGGAGARMTEEVPRAFDLLARMLVSVERGERPRGLPVEPLIQALRAAPPTQPDGVLLRIRFAGGCQPAAAALTLQQLQSRGLARLVAPDMATVRGPRFAGHVTVRVDPAADAEETIRKLMTVPQVAEVVRVSAHAGPQEPASGRERETWLRVRGPWVDDALECALDLMLEHGRLVATAGELPVRARRHYERCEMLLRRLYRGLMELRLVPFRSIGPRLASEVERLAAVLDKRVEFSIEGPELRLDRSLLETLADPLVHMLRNALDHGVEPAAERQALGKPPSGVIRLILERVGDRARVVLQDDGRGLDLDVVRRAALERGLIAASDAAELSGDDAWRLITLPGFSTAREVGQISGRGVGMDVVRHTVEMLGGTIDIRSASGSGTSIELSLPLTLALIRGVVTRRNGELYVVPASMVSRVVSLAAVAPEDVAGWALHDVERGVAQPPEAGELLMLEAPGGPTGLLMDEVLAEREVVVRPLAPPLSGLRPFAGAALLEDGDVALVIDPYQLDPAA